MISSYCSNPGRLFEEVAFEFNSQSRYIRNNEGDGLDLNLGFGRIQTGNLDDGVRWIWLAEIFSSELHNLAEVSHVRQENGYLQNVLKAGAAGF